MGPKPSVPSDSLAGVHVLVVDDNPDARELLRTILEYAGALVTLAESAERALRVIDYAVPHILISDISMPAPDGWWLIQQIRSRGPMQGGSVPAIALTALTDDNAGKIRAAGFQAYLRKPVDPWELCRLVESLVPPSG